MSKSKPRCPRTSTDQHASGCYQVHYPACNKTEHTEHLDRACYYQKGPNEGQLKCTTPLHTHDREKCAEAIGPLCGGT